MGTTKIDGRIADSPGSVCSGSAKFGVLPPEVGLDRFQHLQEAQDGRVSFVDLSVAAVVLLSESTCWRVEESRSDRRCACRRNTSFQK